MTSPMSMRIYDVTLTHVFSDPGRVFSQRIRGGGTHDVALVGLGIEVPVGEKGLFPRSTPEDGHGRESEERRVSRDIVPREARVPDPYSEDHEVVGELLILETVLRGQILATDPHVVVNVETDAAMESFDAVAVEARLELQRPGMDVVTVHRRVLTVHFFGDDDLVTVPRSQHLFRELPVIIGAARGPRQVVSAGVLDTGRELVKDRRQDFLDGFVVEEFASESSPVVEDWVPPLVVSLVPVKVGRQYDFKNSRLLTYSLGREFS